MTDKECKRYIRDYNKRDIYTTHTQSVESFVGFLNQCKRAINKLYFFYGAPVSVKSDFWSAYAKEQAYNHLIKYCNYDNLSEGEKNKVGGIRTGKKFIILGIS